jgi:hypothetical protein
MHEAGPRREREPIGNPDVQARHLSLEIKRTVSVPAVMPCRIRDIRYKNVPVSEGPRIAA